MGLKYIFGRAGTGKTTQVLSQIIKHQETYKDNTIIYIVPEQFSLQAEKDILNLTISGATASINVLSFKRLAFHVFSETGVKKLKLLDDVSKIMLIRKILFKLKGSLTFFGKTKITKGFIDKVSNNITEFYKYGVKPHELSAVLKHTNASQSLALKVQDMSLIYNAYVDYINDNYISIDETLDVLSEKIIESAFLHGANIWIDGFNGFTNQEYKVIKEIMKKASNVTVAISVNEPSITYNNIIETDTFYETKHTINKLSKIANEVHIEIGTPLYLEENKRHKNSPQLKYLEQNLFNVNAEVYTSELDSIKIKPALNTYDEITYVSEEIVRLIKENGYAYSNIAVISANTQAYQKCVQGIFKKHSIPFFMDSNKDMLAHPLFELIRATLDIIIQNWSYESVFRFLKTGMLDITPHEVDILENYVLAYGIKGHKWKSEEWFYGFNGYYEKFNKEEIHSIKQKVLNYILPFEKGITNKTKLTVKEISIKFFNMLYLINITNSIENLINEAIEEKNIDLVGVHSQVWDKVCDIFEKMVNVLGEEEVTILEFASILESGMLAETVGILPPTQDQVIIGDIERSRLPSIKALFVIGVNDGIFPRQKLDEGLFNDKERLLIDSLGIELAPTSVKRAFEENFLIYNSLLKAESYLVITYSQGGLDGKQLLPSYIISHIKKLFNNNINFNTHEEPPISTPDFMLSKLSIALKDYYENESISNTNLVLYKWFKNYQPYTINKIENIAISNNKIEKLSSASIKKLYGKEINTSISKLEKYVQCPFSFFVNYNLKAKERKIYQVLTVDLGEIFHDILEEFTKMSIKDNLDFKTITQADINKYVDICVKNIIENLDKDIFFSSTRSKYILERVIRISKKSIWALCEHIKNGDFVIYGSEVGFGGKSPLTGIIIEIDENRKFVFTGRVDRIDIMDTNGNKYVKIIDYKSGNKKFDITDIYYGMQLQLILYLDTIIKNGKKYFNMENTSGDLLPGGIFYFKIDDPIIDINSKSSKQDIEELLLKNFKMSGIVLENETVINAMDKNIQGSSNIVPVSVNKDGSYGKSSNLATKDTFDNSVNFTIQKVKEIGIDITQGKIAPFPYKKGNINACTYCNYKPICNFDPKDTQTYSYNTFNKKIKIEDLK